VNHGAAYPKFFSSAVVRSGAKALFHAFLIPFNLETSIQGGRVSIDSQTAYPFGSVINYSINSTTSFHFGVRVPRGVSNASTITISDERKPLVPQSNGVYWNELERGLTHIAVDLQYKLEVVKQVNNSVSVYYGPVLYSLDVPYTESISPALNWTDRSPLTREQLLPSVHDHVLLPLNDTWQIAIDPSQIAVESQPSNPDLPNPLFARGQPPCKLSVAATRIEWPITKDTADLPPDSPQPVGASFRATLVPYGSAKLHIAEFPTISLGNGSIQYNSTSLE
jgi:hypothetical protein